VSIEKKINTKRGNKEFLNMKIIGIATSPRKEQTTYQALKLALEAAAGVDDSIETELIDLAGIHIHPCQACNLCKTGVKCSIDDDFTKLLSKFEDDEIGGVIVASPVYMGSMSAVCKCFLDRSVIFRRNGFMWKDVVGGAIALGHSRNGGQELTISAIHHTMQIHDMVIVSDGAPTAHFGGTMWTHDGVANDAFGISTTTGLGKRVAELALRLKS
jgi:multimeric flavodoxin WrbA